MNKTLALLTLSAALIAGAAAKPAPAEDLELREYPATFRVLSVEDTGRLLIESTGGTMRRGELWEIDGDADAEPGAILTAIMVDYGTPDDCTDDAIKEIRWTGLHAGY